MQGTKQLQASITKNSAWDSKGTKKALMEKPESPEAFSTFRIGLMKGKVNPNELLVISSILSIELDSVYIRYAALALRYGAKPNLYIPASFPLEDGTFRKLPIHLAKHVWDLTPRTKEESVELDFKTYGDYNDMISEQDIEERFKAKIKASRMILSLLALKGFIPEVTVTNQSLLVKMGIDATNFAVQNPLFFNSVIGLIEVDGELGASMANDIKYYRKWKDRLQDVIGVSPQRDQEIIQYAFLLDIVPILTLSDVYGNADNLRPMVMFQDNDSLKAIIPTLRNVGALGSKSSKDLELLFFDWATAYYNQMTIKHLLEQAIFPDIHVRSQVIRASKIVCKSYTLQCSILLNFLVMFAEYGYGLSTEQLNELSFSPKTQARIRKLYETPQWKYECRVKSDEPTQYLKELSRSVGISVGSTKRQMCDTLEDVGKSDPVSVKKAITGMNRAKIQASSTSLGSLVTGQSELPTLNEDRSLPVISGSINDAQDQLSPAMVKAPSSAESVMAPLCTNQALLVRPITDYPDIDKVSYSDGRETWCFTSDNYRDLIMTGTNPWAKNGSGGFGEKIPDQVLSEMRTKLGIIDTNGLSRRAASMSQGVDDIFTGDAVRTASMYQEKSDRTLMTFLQFMEEYGVPPGDFSELSSSSIQSLSDTILSPTTRVLVDSFSPSLALRDFADAFLTEASSKGNGDELAQSLSDAILG